MSILGQSWPGMPAAYVILTSFAIEQLVREHPEMSRLFICPPDVIDVKAKGGEVQVRIERVLSEPEVKESESAKTESRAD